MMVVTASCAKESPRQNIISVQCSGEWRSTENSNLSAAPRENVEEVRFGLLINEAMGTVEAVGDTDEALVCASDRKCKAVVSEHEVTWGGTTDIEIAGAETHSNWSSQLDRVTGLLMIKKAGRAASSEINVRSESRTEGRFSCQKSEASNPLPRKF